MAFSLSGSTITQTGTDTDLSGLAGIAGVSYSDDNGQRIADLDSTLSFRIDGSLIIDPSFDLLIMRKDGNDTLLVYGDFQLGLEYDRGNGVTHYSTGTALRHLGRSTAEWSSNITAEGSGSISIYGASVVSGGALEAADNATLKIRDGKFDSLSSQRTTTSRGNQIYFGGNSVCDIIGLYKTNGGNLDSSVVSILNSNVTVLNLEGITASGEIQFDDRASGPSSSPPPLAIASNLQYPVGASAWTAAGQIVNSNWHEMPPIRIIHRGPFYGPDEDGGEIQALKDIEYTFTQVDGTPIDNVLLYFRDANNGNRGASLSTAWADMGQDYLNDRTVTGLSNANGEVAIRIMEAAWYNRDLVASTRTPQIWEQQDPSVIRDIRINSDLTISLYAIKYNYNIQPLLANGSQVDKYTASVSLINDSSITESDKSAVDAYSEIDNSARLYDKAKAYLVDNYAGETATLVTRNADTIASSHNITVDANASAPFSFDGSTITIKAAEFVGNLDTTGDVTLLNGAVVRGAVFSATQDSALREANGATFTIYASEADRDARANPIASGATQYDFLFSALTANPLYLWVTSGATELPFTANIVQGLNEFDLGVAGSINALFDKLSIGGEMAIVSELARVELPKDTWTEVSVNFASGSKYRFTSYGQNDLRFTINSTAPTSTSGGTHLPEGMAIQFNGTKVWMLSDTGVTVTPIEVG